MFANRTLAHFLGYDGKFFNNKTINCLMPMVIADVHHHFWRKFNENGVPSFIER
jgi:hypothetical protein